MATARKELSRTVIGYTEVIQNKYLKFDFDTYIRELIDDIFDDFEYAQEHGVYYYEDDLYSIDVNSCIDELNDRLLMNDDEEETEDDEKEPEEKIIEYLTPYKDFTIWV